MLDLEKDCLEGAGEAGPGAKAEQGEKGHLWKLREGWLCFRYLEFRKKWDCSLGCFSKYQTLKEVVYQRWPGSSRKGVALSKDKISSLLSFPDGAQQSFLRFSIFYHLERLRIFKTTKIWCLSLYSSPLNLSFSSHSLQEATRSQAVPSAQS